jgi:hypothetical protein
MEGCVEPHYIGIRLVKDSSLDQRLSKKLKTCSNDQRELEDSTVKAEKLHRYPEKIARV